MAKILVLYYSGYGHVETMANAVAEGAGSVNGCTADVKRVPEIAAPEMVAAMGLKTDQAAPIATPDELANYDAIIIGTPTRFGNMASQMRHFLDQTGGLWFSKALCGKVGSAFCATASQHGGQETTLTSIHLTLMHHGMIVVGLPTTFEGMSTMDEIAGNTPYGATTIAGKGDRMPSAVELDGARFQGRHVAEIATKLFG